MRTAGDGIGGVSGSTGVLGGEIDEADMVMGLGVSGSGTETGSGARWGDGEVF